MRPTDRLGTVLLRGTVFGSRLTPLADLVGNRLGQILVRGAVFVGGPLGLAPAPSRMSPPARHPD